MNFRRPSDDDYIEINLVPLIDVLLVILIFLAATTTFTRITQLEVQLPRVASGTMHGTDLNIAISQDGIYALDGQLLSGNTSDDIAQALRDSTSRIPSSTLVISADARTPHEAVVRAMEAATRAGIEKINFATQDRR